MQRYKHTDTAHNSGVVWGRVLHIHPDLLQQVEMTLYIAPKGDDNLIPFPTAGKTRGLKVL